MITAETHAEASDLVLGLLTGVSAPVHAPPVPTSTVGTPAILVQVPQAQVPRSIGCATWEFTVSVLVVSRDPQGTDLLTLVDEVSLALRNGGIRTSSAPTIYQAANTPAGIPAMIVNGE